ncbi:ABC transporter ATP-binding protein [Zwartia sp.]|uniref:ABC transporter ATP-binding protein n=1 Tax=Zwartia sp. TaxID=2978004 RepID=UPI00271D315A|nr:ABC transporter ATP-binding protein [Zwartia sp.]MDO9024116.1 ABC transporter ATP-binding protein [Zwartia sp.]
MGIRVSNLIKIFDKTTIVHGISFDVADGEFVTLLGPSGCGKTTTLRCIAGLERTNGGMIEIDGQVVSQPEKDIFAPPHERNLGMVFQSYAIWPHMSVAENIAFPLVARGSHETDTKQAVLWALEIVGLTGMGDRQPSELSGGQQQRVALARAIVGKPKVLLFDEPLSNLDARLRDRTRAEISRIQKELAIPAVYVTHDQAEALSMSDRVIVMEGGHIIEEGEPRKLYRKPNKRFTAEFIGAANFLTVTYKGQNWYAPDGSALTLEESVTGQEGEQRTAVLRSEHLDIRLPDEIASDGHVNALHGTIEHVQYMGPHIEYAISVQGVPMNVTHQMDFGPGTQILVTFGPADIHLLPRES